MQIPYKYTEHNLRTKAVIGALIELIKVVDATRDAVPTAIPNTSPLQHVD